jgi:hypothetical protein
VLAGDSARATVRGTLGARAVAHASSRRFSDALPRGRCEQAPAP